MKKQDKNINFEEAMENLENIVENLEKGELPLEESVQKFKEGIELSNYCEKLLDDAEKSITILLKDKNGEITEENFDVE